MVPENINTHPEESLQKFQAGGAGSKPQIFIGKYEAKPEFPGGLQTKKFSHGRGMDNFRNNTLHKYGNTNLHFLSKAGQW